MMMRCSVVLSMMMSVCVPSGVSGYSIKDAAPVGGAKSEEAQSFVRKEEEETQQPAAAATALSERQQLLQEAAEVLQQQNYELRLEEAKQRKADKLAAAAVPSEQKQKEAFDLFDQDGNGSIDHEDLRAVMNAFGKKVMLHDVGDKLAKDVLDDVLSAADQDGDGQVTFKDYSGFLQEMAHHANFANTLKSGHSTSLLSILSDETSMIDL